MGVTTPFPSVAGALGVATTLSPVSMVGEAGDIAARIWTNSSDVDTNTIVKLGQEAEVGIGLVIMVLALLALYMVHIRWRRMQDVAEKATGRMQDCDNYSRNLVKLFMPSQQVQKYQFRGMKPPENTIDLEFDKLGLELNNGQNILRDVTGVFAHGRMAAIMGPSGAGKTTFMNVLAGKATYGKMLGEVRVNGMSLDIPAISSIMGFVPQDDVVHENLTVREQIRFSADLRNKVTLKKRQINNIVNDVLNVMQIDHIQNSIVGSVEERGISGGQRKRVNIGLELAGQPALLFLDEPTSGLDSTSSLTVVYSLKKMCQLGMNVIMVIHQPRYSLYTLFDDVLLLGKGGQTVYLGSSLGTKAYFDNLGFEVKEGENLADFFMDVVSGEVTNSRDPYYDTQKLFDEWRTNEQSENGSANGSVKGDPELGQVARKGSSGQKKIHRMGSCGRDVITEHEEKAMVAGTLEEQWNRYDTNDDGFLDITEIHVLLTACSKLEPSDRVCLELVERMAGQGSESVTKPQFVQYLVNQSDSVAHDARDQSPQRSTNEDKGWSVQTLMRGLTPMNEESDSSEESSSDEDNEAPLRRNEVKKLHRETPGYSGQFRIVAFRTLIQWWRQNTKRAIYFAAMGAGAVVLAVQDNITEQPKWEALSYVNTHTCVGLLTAIFCLNIFGTNQPVFWRERNRGLNVVAFFQGRILLNSIDLFMLTYEFCAIYYIIRNVDVPFFQFWYPFLLVAFASSGWGYFVSTVLPPQHGPFVVSLISFVVCGLLGNPSTLAKFLDNKVLGFMVSVISITRWSIPMGFVMQVDTLPPTPKPGQEQMMFMMYNDTLRGEGFGGMDEQWSGTVALLLYAGVLRFAALLGLMFKNRDKQV